MKLLRKVGVSLLKQKSRLPLPLFKPTAKLHQVQCFSSSLLHRNAQQHSSDNSSHQEKDDYEKYGNRKQAKRNTLTIFTFLFGIYIVTRIIFSQKRSSTTQSDSSTRKYEKKVELTPDHLALIDALQTGNEEKIRELLDNKLNLNFTHKRGKHKVTSTPLNDAIYYYISSSDYPFSIVELLLQKGADVNFPGEEALLYLARYSFYHRIESDPDSSRIVQVLDLLMSKNPDLTRKSYFKENVLHTFTQAEDVFIYFVDHYLTPQQLHDLVHEQTKDGENVMHKAASNSRKLTQFLLNKANPDLSIKDNSENTVLHNACHALNFDNVLAILNACNDKAYINLKNASGETPLAVAARSSDRGFSSFKESKEKIIHLLLETGADPYALTVGGEPALPPNQLKAFV